MEHDLCPPSRTHDEALFDCTQGVALLKEAGDSCGSKHEWVEVNLFFIFSGLRKHVMQEATHFYLRIINRDPNTRS